MAETKTTKKTTVKKTATRAAAVPKKAAASSSVSGLAVNVFDLTGKETGTVQLPKEIFDVEANPKLIAQYVRVYRTNQRQGTVSTKTRSMIQASTRKIYRQKGTGRARHGAKSAPIFVGGGVTFGPQPVEYRSSLNKKQRRLALFAALTMARKDNKLSGLSDVAMESPKTAQVAGFLKTRELSKKKTLIVVPKMEKNALVLSSRNIPTVSLTDASSLNAYAVLNANAIVFAESAVDALKNHFIKNHEN